MTSPAPENPRHEILDYPQEGLTIDILNGWSVDMDTFVSSAPAYETAGVLRAQRSGLKGERLMEATGITNHDDLQAHIYLALDAEQQAMDAGKQIHDPRVPKSA
ncbi:hypothetical protein PXH69_24510 [Rhodococcus qingshengii]|uniref:Gp68-like predicted RNA polymerase component domain-containing protein n=1 Tax=Rhodococcus qingshengii TaxID=334542 RepID=A0AAW6LN35_RHOSG|nr:hypothetical protein [Rhodococcus qingshengii]MDE8648134.1 hypothetical protein [Rhodococcus qingshengii]